MPNNRMERKASRRYVPARLPLMRTLSSSVELTIKQETAFDYIQC